MSMCKAWNGLMLSSPLYPEVQAKTNYNSKVVKDGAKWATVRQLV